MKYNIANIETVISNKLNEAVIEFENKEIKIIDIGIFPWHHSIEISFLFTAGSIKYIEYVDDIASWEHYAFSAMAEGKWSEGKVLANEMGDMYSKNEGAHEAEMAEVILNDFAKAVNSEKVIKTLKKFTLADDFIIQILHPDDPETGNYIQNFEL